MVLVVSIVACQATGEGSSPSTCSMLNQKANKEKKDLKKMVYQPKYKFAMTGNTVIAISTYAGKTVKGYAKCHPNDHFDLETGKTLAELRCAQKIAEKRFNRAVEQERKAKVALEAAELHRRDMGDYRADAAIAWDKADTALKNFMNTIKGE